MLQRAGHWSGILCVWLISIFSLRLQLNMFSFYANTSIFMEISNDFVNITFLLIGKNQYLQDIVNNMMRITYHRCWEFPSGVGEGVLQISCVVDIPVSLTVEIL